MMESAPKQVPPYGLRLPPDLKDRVQAAAKANNRSMNAEIVATLEEKYPAPVAIMDFISLTDLLLEQLPFVDDRVPDSREFTSAINDLEKVIGRLRLARLAYEAAMKDKK